MSKNASVATSSSNFPNESSRLAYQKIQLRASLTERIIAVDYDRNYMHIFKGKAGSWKLEKSFRVITGPKRYFGNEKKRKSGATQIGLSHLTGNKFIVNKDSPEASFAVKITSGNDPNYIHAMISPGIKEGVNYHTYGKDLVAQRLARGEYHRGSDGCIELKREDAIWFYNNVAKKNTVCYVWTEKAAKSSDIFENNKLKNIMIRKKYHDVNQLTASEKKSVYG